MLSPALLNLQNRALFGPLPGRCVPGAHLVTERVYRQEIRPSLTQGAGIMNSPGADMEAGRQFLDENWIGDQLGYHVRTHKKHMRRSKRFTGESADWYSAARLQDVEPPGSRSRCVKSRRSEILLSAPEDNLPRLL